MYPMYTAMVHVIITKKEKKFTIFTLFFELRHQFMDEVEAQSNGTISPRMCPFLGWPD